MHVYNALVFILHSWYSHICTATGSPVLEVIPQEIEQEPQQEDHVEVQQEDLPECPNHVGVDFEEGKPRSILPSLLIFNSFTAF